jgi:cellulose synthase/poly-beta-1,6-N-acetylglucosamine synthase-like glycosyltransferase
MSEELMSALGIMNLGDTPVTITTPNLTPRGVNYSIRRSFLESVGGFDPNLGRVGTKLLSNEELYMTELALKQGWQVGYFPDALVYHHVAPERLKRSWFFRRSWWQGISEYYRQYVAEHHSAEQTGKTTAKGRSSRQILQGIEGCLRGIAKSIKYIQRTDLCWQNLIYAYGQVGYIWQAIQGPDSEFLNSTSAPPTPKSSSQTIP